MPCPHGTPITDAHYNAFEDLYETYGKWSDVAALCPCMALNPPGFWLRRWKEQLEEERISRIEDEMWRVRYEERKKTPAPSVQKKSKWLFCTLTQPVDYGTDCSQILQNATRIIESAMVSPTEWCYSLELTEKGIPHIHMSVLPGKQYLDWGKIAKLNTNGLRGADKVYWRAEIEKDRGHAKKYVVKAESKPNQEYLDAHGLESWFWCSENYSGPRPNIFSSPDINNGQEGNEETRSPRTQLQSQIGEEDDYSGNSECDADY